MAITVVTAREFNRNISRIKRDARNGPVFITNRGLPTHVLISISLYQKLTKNQNNIINL